MRSRPTVAVLLSTFGDSPFLDEQLRSIALQANIEPKLLWRDDSGVPTGPCRIRTGLQLTQGGHLGIGASYMALLAAAPDETFAFAFSDQDDVWLPHKLARACAKLAEVPEHVPALYCGRQHLVDVALCPLGLSPLPQRQLGFRNALVQNVATGCTIVLNRAARDAILSMPLPAGGLHDWWCYIVVSALGGRLLYDRQPMLLYRQHASNAVGAPQSVMRRGMRAMKRGPHPFMRMLAAHLYALRPFRQRLTEANRATLDAIAAAEGASVRGRLQALRASGAYRQRFAEDLVLRAWFALSELPPSSGRNGAPEAMARHPEPAVGAADPRLWP